MITAALALLAQALPPAAPPPLPPQSTCDQPVVMVVAGPTHDRARMLAYGRAIAESGLYRELGGYYVNVPQPLAQFEGEPPAGYVTLIVRFPCLENARTFWNSRTYQEDILPLRQNPSAGDYFVTVYAEASLPEYMVGQVGDARYQAEFSGAGIEQVRGSGRQEGEQ